MTISIETSNNKCDTQLMNYLSNISDDLFIAIIKNVQIKDLITMNSISKYFNDKLKNEIDEYIYEIAKTRNLNEKTKEYILAKSLFRIYYRGKSYNDNDYPYRKPRKNAIDMVFEFRDEEYVLYYSKIKLSTSGPGSIIVTIDRYYDYIVYEFCQEVDTLYESTPDYFGWDRSDMKKQVLKNKKTYDNIKNLNIEFRTGYNNDPDSEPEESVGNLKIYKRIFLIEKKSKIINDIYGKIMNESYVSKINKRRIFYV